MTATHGEGAYGNATGVTTPTEHKMAQVTEFVKTTTANVIRPGVLYNGNASLITGKANMSYDVSAFSIATQRSATSGVMKWANDGIYNATTTAAPGSNSRIDLIVAWHREYALDGTDSNPVIFVVQGTPAAPPTAPSLASYPGAIELGRATVGAGITATTSATITQTAPFTSVDGGKVAFRTTTEMNLWTTALTDQRALDLSSGVTYRWNGSSWKQWESDWISWATAPTNLTVGTGGSASSTQRYKWINGRPRFDYMYVFGTTGASMGTSPTLNLPISISMPVVGSLLEASDGGIRDVSVPSTPAYTRLAVQSATTATIVTYTGTTASITSTAPITWAAGDILAGGFWADPA